MSQAVDPLRCVALKGVAAVVIQQRLHRVSDLVELVGAEQVRQDHVPVALHRGQVCIYHRRVDALAGAVGSRIGAGVVGVEKV
jgi:hypothetical protein